MRGVVLAGGLGTRLDPLTRVTNKHLLPIYSEPMIHYPLRTLQTMGIKETLIVTGGNSAGDFLKLLGNGSDFGMQLYYAYQVGEGGIADALRLAEGFVDGKFIVMLGDNIILKSLAEFADDFCRQEAGARVLLKEVHDPQRFGVATISGRQISKIVEKPKKPESNYAVTGVYGFDRSVFNVIQTLRPSGRGELEITDVNMHYATKGTLCFNIWRDFWSDARTFESLAAASLYVRDVRCNSF